jgi:hypothetical protein
MTKKRRKGVFFVQILEQPWSSLGAALERPWSKHREAPFCPVSAPVLGYLSLFQTENKPRERKKALKITFFLPFLPSN